MKRITLAAALSVCVMVFTGSARGQVQARDPDPGPARPTLTQEERIQQAIVSMRARAVFPKDGEVGETGEWVPPPSESVMFVSDGAPDFGARLQVALLAADTAAAAGAVSAVLLPDPRIVSVTSILTTTVTPTVAELSAFDAVLVWSNSTPLNNVTLGDNLATYVDNGGGCVLTMFAIRATLATRTIGGRFLADNYYCISQSVGASTTGAATLGGFVEPGSQLVDGVATFSGGTSSFRSPAAVTTNAVPVANWSTGQTLVAHRDDFNGGRVDLNFFCVPAPTSAGSWDQSTDGRMLLVNALAMASKQNLWHTLHSQTPFAATTAYRNSNLPGISPFSDQQWADDFTLANGGIVTDLTLWAVYTNNPTAPEPAPPLQELTVRFFADNAGVPGTQIISTTGLTLTFRDTGVTILAAPGVLRSVYEYRVSLLAAFVAEPGVKYWVSPLGNTAGKTWAWASATGAGGTSAFRTSEAGAWVNSGAPGNMAMVLGSDEFRFGGEAEVFSNLNVVRGNCISVARGQVLDRIVMKLDLPVGGATLYTYVMEANTTAGPFTPIFTRSSPFVASVLGWYSSGTLNVILSPGKVYFVGMGWNAETVDFFRQSGQPSTWPLGTRYGLGGINGAANPVAGPQAVIGPLTATEYDMRLLFSVAETCYANCDGSTGNPLLTANDFQCFIDQYAANDPYANCDAAGGLTANDFQCFLNAFAAGCP